MERNMIKAVMEKQSEASEDTANRENAGWPSNGALPCSFVPPGTELEVAKETPAISAATREQEFEVSLSHSLLSFTRFLCASEKTSPGVFPFLLIWKGMYFGANSLTYYSKNPMKGSIFSYNVSKSGNQIINNERNIKIINHLP